MCLKDILAFMVQQVFHQASRQRESGQVLQPVHPHLLIDLRVKGVEVRVGASLQEHGGCIYVVVGDGEVEPVKRRSSSFQPTAGSRCRSRPRSGSPGRRLVVFGGQVKGTDAAETNPYPAGDWDQHGHDSG